MRHGTVSGWRRVNPRTVTPRHVDIISRMFTRLTPVRINEETVCIDFLDRYRCTWYQRKHNIPNISEFLWWFTTSDEGLCVQGQGQGIQSQVQEILKANTKDIHKLLPQRHITMKIFSVWYVTNASCILHIKYFYSN